MKNQKGFTLIELMVVIVIIGILAAVAIPRMTGLSDKAKASEAVNGIGAYENLQQAYALESTTVGSSKQIGFEEPTSKHMTWAVGTAGTVQAGFTVATSNCGAGAANGWQSITKFENGAATFSRALNDTDCESLTPSFVSAR